MASPLVEPQLGRGMLGRYARQSLRADATAAGVALLACLAAARWPANAYLLLLTAAVANVWFIDRRRALPVTLGTLALVAVIGSGMGESKLAQVAKDVPHVVLFVTVVVLVDASTDGLRRARAAAERHVAELDRLNARLEQEKEEVQALSDQLSETNDALTAALRASEESAHRAARAREEVLGVVAHDLRNPLNLVGTTTQLLIEPGLPADRRAAVHAMSMRAVGRMNRLIGDLLDVVRMEEGRLALDVAPCDLNGLLAEAAEAFRARAAEQGVMLEHVAAPADPVVRADGERLLQLLDNLVGNALKFTPRGGRVRISGYVEREMVRVAVADTGPGIPAQQADRLFERFWQARGTDRRGLGLGLAIAKGIAEAHGGRLWVESAVGHGSTFQFTIPAIA
jgi:signal transduction histidine kinase